MEVLSSVEAGQCRLESCFTAWGLPLSYVAPMTDEHARPSEDPTPVEYAWRAHPARERFAAAIGAIAVIVGIGLAIHISFQSAAWSIGSAVVLVIALNRFFFPSSFAIDAEGITASFPLRRQRLSWSALRRFVCDGHGGYLSTRSRRSWLDAYRGMHVLFGDRRDAVVERIRARLPEGARSWAT